MPELDIARWARQAQENRYLITQHAQQRMGLRRITHAHIKYVVAVGDVVEQHPDNKPDPKACSWLTWKDSLCTFLAPSMATVLISLLCTDMTPNGGSIRGREVRNDQMANQTSCARCGGTLERKTITHQQPWGDELYEFENVPAFVCRQCGEVWLEAEVGQLIDRIIKEHPQPKKYHQVPVFSLTEFSF